VAGTATLSQTYERPMILTDSKALLKTIASSVASAITASTTASSTSSMTSCKAQ